MTFVAVSIEAEIKVGEAVVKAYYWRGDVMHVGQVKGWCRRQFNAALKRADRDQLVSANFFGQLKKPPYTIFSGELGGVNGKTLRQRGAFDA